MQKRIVKYLLLLVAKKFSLSYCSVPKTVEPFFVDIARYKVTALF